MSVSSATFEPADPFSGSEIAAALRSQHAACERYLQAIAPPEFVLPQGEKWSPADHVRHLAKSTFPLAKALGLPKLLIGLRFGRSKSESQRYLELRNAYRKRLTESGATAGRFAPSQKPVPADAAAWQREILASWGGAVAALNAKAVGWSEPALDRYRLPHPLLGLLTVREMLFFTLYHNAHHLGLVAGRR